MSGGARIPLDAARGVAAWLVSLLGEPGKSLQVVGSVRRGKSDVGDIEFVAPLPLGRDTLCDALERVLAHPDRLFGRDGAVGEATRGVHPGFRSCSFVVAPPSGVWPAYVPVEVHRYDTENRGWITALRTGPAAYAKDVLVAAVKGAGFALRGGNVVDACGLIVPVPDERAFYRLCNLAWVEPEARGA